MRNIKFMICLSIVVTCIYLPTYIFKRNASCASPYTDLQMSTTLFSFITTISLVMIYTYSRIMVVAIRHKRNIASSERTKTVTVSTVCDALSQEDDRKLITKKQIQQTTTKKQEFKAAKTVAVIVGCFFLCWIPIIAVRTAKLITKSSHPIFFYMTDIGSACCQINICLTWLIYGLTDKNMKKAFIKILCCKA
ncbi:hypothetical protein HELRODRAFT_162628 [Helobdella robusta]|uniref:G-protein coupled receptors family 1 profile domain-containing protein n=1 Tax=Helobdella robusta TaxID=6412 RepID=T1ESX9_HELRO|nr:hypothetical protein HELRODRAFT_162628 [Helobdella robusta]ESN99133.1 hypothetical protein HELRODRAFT_162628 [Helobdella robusta]